MLGLSPGIKISSISPMCCQPTTCTEVIKRWTYGCFVLHVQSEAVITRSLHPRDGQRFHTTLRQHRWVRLRRHCATCTVHDGRAKPAENKCTADNELAFSVAQQPTMQEKCNY